MTLLIVAAAAGSFILADAPPPSQRGCPVAGNYTVAGTNPGGGNAYAGTAKITARDGECHIYWAPPNESEGTGSYANGTLRVTFRFAGGEGGVVVYTRKANGVLQGTWSLFGEGGGEGTETLTPY